MSSPRMICVDANLVVRRVADPDNQAVQSLWDGWDMDGMTAEALRVEFWTADQKLAGKVGAALPWVRPFVARDE